MKQRLEKYPDPQDLPLKKMGLAVRNTVLLSASFLWAGFGVGTAQQERHATPMVDVPENNPQKSPLRSVVPIPKTKVFQEFLSLQNQVQSVSRKGLFATVALVSPRGNSSGTGVIINKDGLVLTAAHVVGKETGMIAIMHHGKQVGARVLGANFSKDIAMVQLVSKEKTPKWPHVELGSSSSLKVGDWVVALGHAEGFNDGRTAPVRFGRIGGRRPGGFILSDCAMIGGDSGGPLFDLNGQLIGIHSSIGQNLNYNSHAGIAGFKEDWEGLIGGKKWGALSLDAQNHPEAPALGIGVAGVAWGGGIVIGSVQSGLPADQAGLRPGDLIVGIDGTPVKGFEQFKTVLLRYEAGERVQVTLLRDQRRLDKEVILTKRAKIIK